MGQRPRTVALEATLQSVAALGLLVLIRAFLSWALVAGVILIGEAVRLRLRIRPPDTGKLTTANAVPDCLTVR